MRSPQYIPSFYFYKFANAVAAPYTSLNAYQSGAIDESGNVISSEGSIDDFEYFVIRLKKIFDQLPPGLTKSRLTNVTGLFQLFSEGVENIGVTQEQVLALIEAHVTVNSDNQISLLELLEDMATGGMSTGSAPGELSVPAEAPEANKGEVSGYDPILGPMQTRNSPVSMFAGIEMFNVSPEEFQKFKQSKAWRHLADSPTKRYLQRFQRRNKDGKMAVRDQKNGDIFFIPYKEKSFMEEFGLQDLSLLTENKNTGLVSQYNDGDDGLGQATLTDTEENLQGIEVNAANVMDVLRQHRENLQTSGALEKAKLGRGKFNPQQAESWAKAMSMFSSARHLRETDPEKAAAFLARTMHYLGKPTASTGKIDLWTPEGPADAKGWNATLGVRFDRLASRGLVFPEKLQDLVTQYRGYAKTSGELEAEGRDPKTDPELIRLRGERAKLKKGMTEFMTDPSNKNFARDLSRGYLSAATEQPISFAIATSPKVPVRLMNAAQVKDFLEKSPLRLEPGRRSGSGKTEGQVQLQGTPFGSREKVMGLPGTNIEVTPETEQEIISIVGKENAPEIERMHDEMRASNQRRSRT